MRAEEMVAQLRRWRPDAEFLGRHLLGFEANTRDVQEQIERSCATIVLVGRLTFDSPFVQYDISASRAKTPPNEILIIALGEDADVSPGSLLLQDLEACGTELITGEPEISGALDRLDLRVCRGEQIARTADAPSGGTCPR